MPNLSHLSLFGVDGVSEKNWLDFFQSTGKLNELIISYSYHMTDKVLDQIAKYNTQISIFYILYPRGTEDGAAITEQGLARFTQEGGAQIEYLHIHLHKTMTYEWALNIVKECPRLKKLDLYNYEQPKDAELPWAYARNLQVFNSYLLPEEFTTDHVNLISQRCKNLRVLTLGRHKIPIKGDLSKVLPSFFPEFEYEKPISQVVVSSFFQNCRFLNEITLDTRVETTDQLMTDLTESCPCLTWLEIVDPLEFTNQGLMELSKLQNLMVFRLHGNNCHIDIEGIKLFVQKCNKLTSLILPSISSHNPAQLALIIFAMRPSLKDLSIGSDNYTRSSVQDE